MTTPAWYLAQLLDVRIVTIDDLSNRSLPPLPEHRPLQGTLRTRREMRVSELRDTVPQLVERRSNLGIKSPLVYGSGTSGPCYVPDRTGNNEYVDALDTDYEFG